MQLILRYVRLRYVTLRYVTLYLFLMNTRTVTQFACTVAQKTRSGVRKCLFVNDYCQTIKRGFTIPRTPNFSAIKEISTLLNGNRKPWTPDNMTTSVCFGRPLGGRSRYSMKTSFEKPLTMQKWLMALISLNVTTYMCFLQSNLWFHYCFHNLS